MLNTFNNRYHLPRSDLENGPGNVAQVFLKYREIAIRVVEII